MNQYRQKITSDAKREAQKIIINAEVAKNAGAKSYNAVLYTIPYFSGIEQGDVFLLYCSELLNELKKKYGTTVQFVPRSFDKYKDHGFFRIPFPSLLSETERKRMAIELGVKL